MYKVLLIGESCIDNYFFGNCNRLSPESPVPVLDFVYSNSFKGMSMNVYRNLESFDFDLEIISNNPDLLIKERYIDDRSKQQLLRVDKGLSVSALDLDINLLERIESADLIVVSDYNKGFLPNNVIKEICDHKTGFMFVDSKKTDLSYFEDCFIKINNLEFSKDLKMPNEFKIIVTQGSKGAVFQNKKFSAPNVNVHDVSGAGDVFLSVLAGSFIINKDIDKSIKSAIALASKSVSYFGNYAISEEDISRYIS